MEKAVRSTGATDNIMTDDGMCDECGRYTLETIATSYCGDGEWRSLIVCTSCGHSTEKAYNVDTEDIEWN